MNVRHSNIPRIGFGRMRFLRMDRLVFCLFILLLGNSTALWAQLDQDLGEPNFEVPDLELVNRGETLKAYRLHPVLSSLIQSSPDTAALNYYRQSSVEGLGLAIGNNGNFVGPRHYKTFFDRLPEWDPFVYGQPFDGLFYRPERVLYYDTKSPYTKLSYHRFGAVEQREEVLDMAMAINLDKRINIGGEFSYLLSRGFYANNQGREVGYRIFGSLRLSRYEAYFSGGNNYLKLQEYGGLANDDYINSPDRFSGSRQQVSSKQIPVKYTSGVGNTLFIGHIYFNHRYHFGQDRQFLLGDRLPNGTRTTVDTTIFVPIASIAHKLEYKKGTRLFIGGNPSLEEEYGASYPYFWEGKTIKGNGTEPDRTLSDTLQVLPFDSTRLIQLHNTVSFQVREGFRPWVKFGMAAYARFENRFYFMRDSIPGNGRSSDFTAYVGGNIRRESGKSLNFDVSGEVAVVGRDVGNVRLWGEASSAFSLWGFPLDLQAHARFHNLKLPPLLEHHRGTYVRWDKDLSFTQSLILGGTFSLPRFGTTLSVNSATLLNYTYFDKDLYPKQYGNPIQVLEARLHHAYNYKKLYWELAASYQICSNKEVLPLPDFAGYASVFLKFKAAKVLDSQIGVDCYFHTAYHAPYYDAATQQFLNQTETIVGNFPLMNAFASFKLRRVRFFLVYNNVLDLLLTPSKRWSLAHMPINPAALRIGISFDFNN